MDAKRCVLWVISTLVVLFLCFIERGRSIQCYLCNPSPNIHGPEYCRTLPTKSNETRQKHLQDCSIYGKKYTMCRKIYQELVDDVRVYYGCASLGSVGCFKRSGTYKIKSDYCTCTGDKCNPACSIDRGAGLVALVVSVTVYFITTAVAR